MLCVTASSALIKGITGIMVDVPKTGEKQEDGESREFKLVQTDTKTKQESAITDENQQKTWQKAFDQSHENDPHPSDIKGLPVVQSSFGIDFGDGQILTAKGVEEKEQIGFHPDKWLKSVESSVKETVKSIFYPDKGHEDEKMHYMNDFNAFYTTDLSRFKINPFIIAALTRNEIEHRNLGIDDFQETQIRSLGYPVDLHPDKVSIGNQQLQIGHITRLVNAKKVNGEWQFPQLEPLRKSPEKLVLEPVNGALVLGAYLQDVALRLERGDDPVPWYDKAHKAEITKIIKELWNSKDPERRTDALIRSYNPGDGQNHVDNVRRHLNLIENGVGKLFM